MKNQAEMAGRRSEKGEMIPLLKRHEIQVLRRAEHSRADVARRAGVSVYTVRRVEKEAAVQEADDTKERKARGIGRPSKAAPFGDQVCAWLADEPELPTQELLRRALEAGYPGHKTAFYALVAGVRPPRSAPVVRFEGLPGKLSERFASDLSGCSWSSIERSRRQLRPKEAVPELDTHDALPTKVLFGLPRHASARSLSPAKVGATCEGKQ